MPGANKMTDSNFFIAAFFALVFGERIVRSSHKKEGVDEFILLDEGCQFRRPYITPTSKKTGFPVRCSGDVGAGKLKERGLCLIIAGMRKFLIATHGAFAQGVKSALDLIIGADAPVYVLQAYLDGNASIEPELIELFRDMGPTDEWIIFTDLLGGSVNNQLLRYALMDRVHLASGFNLPLLIEVILSDSSTPAEEVIESALRNAKDQMVYVNKLLTARSDQADIDYEA